MTDQSDLTKDWSFCLAPMMKRTDRHFRYLLRLISKDIRLFTEMIPAEKIVFGSSDRALKYSDIEQPVCLQLGGSNFEILSRASTRAVESGYEEINLNCGCPSPQVQKGEFGAKLMLNPKKANSCVKAMADAVNGAATISVKIRLGVDETYCYQYLKDFCLGLLENGASVIYVHARKALLSITPRKNREIPPLNYDWVYKLKEDLRYPKIILNGGVNPNSVKLINRNKIDGIMIGRFAYEQPLRINNVLNELADFPSKRKQENILSKYASYVENEIESGTPARIPLKHLLNFYSNQRGAKNWRRYLNTCFTQTKFNRDEFSENLFAHCAYNNEVGTP